MRVRRFALCLAAGFSAGCATTQPRLDDAGYREEPLVLTVNSDPASVRSLKLGKSTTSVSLRIEADCDKGVARRFFTVAPQGNDLILGYQTGRGAVPVRLQGIKEFRPAEENPRADAFGKALVSGFFDNVYGASLLIISAPIWYPIKQAVKEANTSHDVEDCYVWIEDAKSGDRIAGDWPWGRLMIEQPSADAASAIAADPDATNQGMASNAAAQAGPPRCPGSFSAERWSNCFDSTSYGTSVYVGEFRLGKPFGQGTMTSQDGQVQSGQWIDGKFVGNR